MFSRSATLFDYSVLPSDERSKKARAYLLWILAKRDYSQSTLEEKLRERKLPGEEIEALIDELIEEKIFDPDAYYSFKVRQLVREGYTVFATRNKLFQAGHRLEEGKILSLLEKENEDLDAYKFEFFTDVARRFLLEVGASGDKLDQKQVSKALRRVRSRGHNGADFMAFLKNSEP